MKKGIIIVFSAFLCVMVLGILGAETGEIHSETETMKEVDYSGTPAHPGHSSAQPDRTSAHLM